jgi:hypothetical protein
MVNNHIRMIRCPLCLGAGWAPLVQGKKSVFARCPVGHRIYGRNGETVDDIAQRLGHDSNKVLIIGADGQPVISPGGAEQPDNGAGIRRPSPEWR